VKKQRVSHQQYLPDPIASPMDLICSHSLLMDSGQILADPIDNGTDTKLG
jgi:hypothetical protein